MLIITETKRTILRQFTLDDATFIHELVNQPAWHRFIGDSGVHSLDDARRYLETEPLASYQVHGFGLYAVDLKEVNAPIGMCGLLKRETMDNIEIGFALLPRFERQGLAFEAATATLAYACDTLGLDRIVAITALDNERSMHLLERLGLRYERLIYLPKVDHPLRLYSLTFSQTHIASEPDAEV